MDSQFGIGVTSETLSLLRLAGALPLVAALLVSFKLKDKKGAVLGIGFLIYLIYQAVVYFFFYASA